MVSLEPVTLFQGMVRLVGQDMIPDPNLQFQPCKGIGRCGHPMRKAIVPAGQGGQPVVVQFHDHRLPEDPASHRIGLIYDHAAGPIHHAELYGEVPVGITGRELVPGPCVDQRQREGRRLARTRLWRGGRGRGGPSPFFFFVVVGPPPPRPPPPPPLPPPPPPPAPPP